MDKIREIKKVIDLQRRKDAMFVETQYARAASAISVLINNDGFCNAMKPYSDVLDEIAPLTDQQEENLDFVRETISIMSGTVDVNLDETRKTDRLHKINEAIKFLTFLRKRYET